jgi:hypothetical protein
VESFIILINFLCVPCVGLPWQSAPMKAQVRSLGRWKRATSSASQEATVRLLDITRLNELSLKSSFD